MTKPPKKVQVPDQDYASHEQVPRESLQNSWGITDGTLLSQKLNDITKLLWVHEDETEQVRQARVVRALELYESLEPADGAEGMLAMQMVGTHDAALDCLRRAVLPNQTFAGRDMALKHAHKLMTLYTQQLATLNKHRGKGQQKVTVEHVNVEPGGQAIVGNVQHGNAAAADKAPAPTTLDHEDMPTLEAKPARKKAKARKAGK